MSVISSEVKNAATARIAVESRNKKMCQIVLSQGQSCRVGSSICADMIKDTLVGLL